MLDKIATSIGRELNSSPETVDIIRYGLESIASTLLSFTFIFILSWLLGVWKVMLLVLGPSALMKTFAGGAHAKTMLGCALFSSIVYTALAKVVVHAQHFLEPYLLYGLGTAAFLSFIAHYRWAPAKNPQHPLSPQYSQKLRKYSFITLGVLWLTYLGVSLMATFPWQYSLVAGAIAGITWHSFTITPWGFKFMDKIDALLSLIKIK